MTNRYLNNVNRPLLAALCFAGIMVLTACGDEGGGNGSRLDSTVPFAEREPNNDTNIAGNADNSGGNNPSDSGGVESPAPDGEVGGSETVNNEDAGSDSVTASSSKLVLRWSVPSRRANGEHLGRDELDGYEIRYRESPEADFTYISLADGGESEFVLGDDLSDNFEFQIAAYDVDGLYSSFVSLVPYEEES